MRAQIENALRTIQDFVDGRTSLRDAENALLVIRRETDNIGQLLANRRAQTQISAFPQAAAPIMRSISPTRVQQPVQQQIILSPVNDRFTNSTIPSPPRHNYMPAMPKGAM